ncbi:MAG: tryptophan synthase subunit alpha [Bacillota bacterium]
MSRIDEAFGKLRAAGKKAVVFYVMAGDPNLAATKNAVLKLAGQGITLCEIGIPFSDPVADGPTIQMAAQRALKSGTTIPRIWDMTAEIRRNAPDFPLVYLTYFNPLVSYGVEEFLGRSREAGVDGLIIPDLPWEESLNYTELFDKNGLAQIHLLAPTTSDKRMAVIASKARGFIYCVSLTGVTGARDWMPPELPEFITRVKKYAGAPVLVGFGVSTPEQAGKVIAAGADGVIVGSKIVELLRINGGDPRQLCEFAGRFLNLHEHNAGSWL